MRKTARRLGWWLHYRLWKFALYKRYDRWRHRNLCFGCGNDKNVGPHGMSEFGGCV